MESREDRDFFFFRDLLNEGKRLPDDDEGRSRWGVDFMDDSDGRAVWEASEAFRNVKLSFSLCLVNPMLLVIEHKPLEETGRRDLLERGGGKSSALGGGVR